jgi:alkyldihydroxyacetonephosphate synthase
MSVLRELRSVLPALRSSDDDADRVAYARDLWPRHHLRVRAGRPAEHKPEGIVWPTAPSELARLVRWARTTRVPLVPFGAGSGVCGGVLPQANALVVDLKRMARIRTIDRDAPLVEVEAGHMGVPLEQTLQRAGFTLGHFPSSILCSTAGGWIATRSAGQCSGAYGKIEDMVASLECVTGAGDVVELRRRCSGPDLVPLVVGSEGTLAIVTSARLRLHPAPSARGFGTWSFPTIAHGLDAMRAIFQAGLRPAVARLYDPFDAMLAKHGGVKAVAPTGVGRNEGDLQAQRAPGRGDAVLRALLKRPTVLNDLLHSGVAARALGGTMLVVIFEGAGESPRRDVEEARRLMEASLHGSWLGEAPAERWLDHRYAVSYRQAPVFANGAFVDTIEVAAPWSKMGALYEAVRSALGKHVFVMAHFSHAYPDGGCIYFSFAGSAGGSEARWDEDSEAVYDRAWRAALQAAVAAGGTLAHHHGVGRSKAPRLPEELGAGIDVVRALMRSFDPDGILNPGNLVPRGASGAAASGVASPAPAATAVDVDATSLLARAAGTTEVGALEQRVGEVGLTLDAHLSEPGVTVDEWLARGAPGSRDRWLDPVDQLMAGFDATLADGRVLHIRPAPRRAVGPDLSALFVGAGGRFGRVDAAWLRVHRRGIARPESPSFRHDRDPPLSSDEAVLLDRVADALASGRP